MANVLHKTADPTDYRESVNTPDFPTATWFVNPDISAVAAVPQKYWARPLTDPVTEMDQAAKDAVDAAEAAADLAARRALPVGETTDTAGEGIRLRALIELLNKRDNYLVNRITELQSAILPGYGGLYRDSAATAQSIPNNVWTKLDALIGSTRYETGGGVTSNQAGGKVTLPVDGVWRIGWHISFSGANNTTFEFAVHVDGVEIDGSGATRALGTGGAAGIGNASGSGIFQITSTPRDLDIRAFHAEIGSRDCTVERLSLWVWRMPSAPASWLATATRTKADAITEFNDDINAGNQDT